ncbi:MAG: 4-hydroxy-3-methylbut-2-enyl diphosphate reductase [Hyphomicrobium sp.]
MQASLTHLRVILARPRGFCAGVVRAIDIVERTIEMFGSPVYVRHEIVHNRHVVERLKSKGAIFVDETDSIPEGAVTVFSAHGVSKAVEAEASGRRLDVIDATCPLVRKVHKEGRSYAERGFDIVLIGHAGHAEVEGTLGQIAGRVHVVADIEDVNALQVADPERVAFITQTTLSVLDTKDIVAALKRRFPAIVGPDTRNICYATQNRQKAVLELARHVQLLLVVGSPNSSNANRLREMGDQAGVTSHLIDDPSAIDPAWLAGVDTLGLTAGASTPETIVCAVIDRLATLRSLSVETQDGADEHVHFRLPDRLTRPAGAVSMSLLPAE